MTFFPEIDIKKTMANADRKLREHRRWRAVASEVGEQKVTATYSFEPRQAHGQPSKPVERLAVNRVDAVAELDAIEFAVGHLYDPMHRRVLHDRYILANPKSNQRMERELGYEKSQFYDILKAALLAFAEMYRSGVLIVEKSEI